MQRPRKRFGQHFLTDPSVVDDILHAIAPAAGDTLVEIGPGRGALTAPLSQRVAGLHLIELDRDLAAALRARYERNPAVTLHEGDALRFEFSALGDDLRVAGNLPYNISTPLLFRLLEHRRRIRDMHFMLQKEVVDRVAAVPGSRRYGRLTVMLGCHLSSEPLFDVPPEAFTPPPRVMSAVLRLAPLPPGTHRIDAPQTLKRIVAQAFSQRRKTVRNALRGHAGDDALRRAGIDPGARPEQIPVAAWVDLANRLGPA